LTPHASYVIFDIADLKRRTDKPLVWLSGDIRTPPFSAEARIESGFLLRRLQQGEMLGLPHSRPMPGIGPQCHELRVNDMNRTWRIVYCVDAGAIVILEVFEKKTAVTPTTVIDSCQQRLAAYKKAVSGVEER
jgi:phage-related protein